MLQYTLDEAKAHLPELIEAAIKGEQVLISSSDNQVLLVPMPLPIKSEQPNEQQGRKPGTAKGLIWMADDFDAPLEDFAEYQ